MDMNNMKIHFDINNLFKVAVFIVVMLLLFEIRNLLLILLASVIIATFAEGFINVAKKIHIPRIVSVIFFYLMIVVLFGGIIFFMVPVLGKELSSLQTLYPEISQYVQNAQLLRDVAEQNITLTEFFDGNDGGAIAQSLFQNISTLVGGLVNLIILFVVSFYLSVQEQGIERFIRILTPIKQEEYAVDLWRRTKKKIGAWFNGQLLLALILTVLTYIGLALLGSPYALLLAILAGIFGMIPYGIVLALVPAVVIAFIHGGWRFGLMVLLMYWIIQQITDYVLQPLILKKLTGLPTLVVILSIIIAGSLAGVIGVVIAVPLAVFILELVHDREHSKQHILDELEHIERENRQPDANIKHHHEEE